MMFRSKFLPLLQQVRYGCCCQCSEKLRHLICFKQWTAQMVMDIIVSAINLKCRHRDTHSLRLNDRPLSSIYLTSLHKFQDILRNSKVMILQEVNEPVLKMAVSKAATLLGAYDCTIIDNVIWEHDYNGCVFSYMADVIFVSTTTHMCVQRFSEKSSVPVLCMRSRTHGTIQSLATIMAIVEELGSMKCLNIAYLGPPHPVLNSYLLLCPMLGANIRFKCCCDKCPVSPLLIKSSEQMAIQSANTVVQECKSRAQLLKQACVVISGPTPQKKDKIAEFTLREEEISKNTCCNWLYFHTCPRGNEVDDDLFYHCNARTFVAYENLHYISAALMAYAVRGYKF